MEKFSHHCKNGIERHAQRSLIKDLSKRLAQLAVAWRHGFPVQVDLKSCGLDVPLLSPKPAGRVFGRERRSRRDSTENLKR